MQARIIPTCVTVRREETGTPERRKGGSSGNRTKELDVAGEDVLEDDGGDVRLLLLELVQSNSSEGGGSSDEVSPTTAARRCKLQKAKAEERTTHLMLVFVKFKRTPAPTASPCSCFPPRRVQRPLSARDASMRFRKNPPSCSRCQVVPEPGPLRGRWLVLRKGRLGCPPSAPNASVPERSRRAARRRP